MYHDPLSRLLCRQTLVHTLPPYNVYESTMIGESTNKKGFKLNFSEMKYITTPSANSLHKSESYSFNFVYLITFSLDDLLADVCEHTQKTLRTTLRCQVKKSLLNFAKWLR